MKKILLFLILSMSLMAKTQTIVFAAGCFWGVEKHFEHLDGVMSAVSGYTGGSYANPNYESVLKHRNATDVTNHAESVKVVYDDSKISTKKLIESFWELHDPTQKNAQGNDKGNNYRSALFYTNDTQKKIALETKERYQILLSKAGFGTITTEIKPLKKFYNAESYHQDYLEKNPFGYCPNHATGVKFLDKKANPSTISPLGGKEIIVIDAPYCIYCKKFKKDVTDHYKGTIPLRTVHKDALKGFRLKNDIEGTPTVILIDNGKELYRHVGYMDEAYFYQSIDLFLK